MRLLKAVKPDVDPCDEVTARRYSGELTEALRQDVRKVVLEASAQSPPERGWQGVAVGGLVISLATWGAWAMNGRQDPHVARASVAFSSANGVRGVRVGAEDLVPTRERGRPSCMAAPRSRAGILDSWPVICRPVPPLQSAKSPTTPSLKTHR